MSNTDGPMLVAEAMGLGELGLNQPRPTRTDVCEKHGEFESRHLFRTIWASCGTCEEERKAEEERERNAEKERQEQRAFENAVRCAGIPARFTDRTIGSFDAVSEAQKSVRLFAENLADELVVKKRTGRCAVFVGKPGTGKTHLAVGIGMHVLRANRSVVFTTVTRLIRRIRDTYNKSNDETEFDAVSVFTDPYLLILDEVGVQRGTDDEKLLLFDVLNDRYENRLSTILLSNLPAKELRGYLGDRVFDRLKEDGGQVVVFDWESRRGQIGGVE